jgi:nitrous-oxide reductase
VNDKIHGRIARIRGDIFECDKITEIPNIQGFHGIFPDKRDPVDQAINHTTRVFCGNEFHIPHPNDGRDADDPTKYKTLFTCVDAETMEVRWQCRVDGNMDLVATSYNGRLAAANQYNVEGGAKYEDMMSAEKDACVFFDVGRIEKAIKDGKFTTIGDSKVPVVDGTKEANKDPKTALTCYVPVPKNPHGVNASPDGKYFICSGKLSPTATVIELAKVEDFLDGKLDDLNKSIVAEVEIGLGPCTPPSTAAATPSPRCSSTARSSNGTSTPPSSSTPATRTSSTWSTASTCITSRATSAPTWVKPKPAASSWRWAASSRRTASCRSARCTPRTSS